MIKVGSKMSRIPKKPSHHNDISSIMINAKAKWSNQSIDLALIKL